MKSYEIVTPLRREGRKHAAGSVVQLAADEAAELLKKRAIAPARFAKAPAAAPESETKAPAKPGKGGKADTTE